jgi:hypothetical protein
LAWCEEAPRWLWFLCWRIARADLRSACLCSYYHGIHGDEQDMNIQHPNHPAITATSIARPCAPRPASCPLPKGPHLPRTGVSSCSTSGEKRRDHIAVNGEIIMKFNILYIFILNTNITKTYCCLENAATILGSGIVNKMHPRSLPWRRRWHHPPRRRRRGPWARPRRPRRRWRSLPRRRRRRPHPRPRR